MTIKQKTIRVALAGNPNCGKSTIFNALTGSRQHVGNWPGKTVEKKEGFCQVGDSKLEIVDLPGTYSLTAYSLEEIVARDYIILEQPDVVVSVIDATNLERNLYLTMQILELGVPLIIALNMADLAESRGIHIDEAQLSQAFQAPIVRTVASDGKGVGELVETILQITQHESSDLSAQPADSLKPETKTPQKKAKGFSPVSHDLAYTRRADFHIDYGREIEQEIVRLQTELEKIVELRSAYPVRWLAIKLLEQDPKISERVKTLPGGKTLLELVQKSVKHLHSVFDEDPDTLIADRRYGWINGLVREVVTVEGPGRRQISERIDDIVTNRFLGIPLFLLSMWLVFKFTTDLSAPLLDWVSGVIQGPISRWLLVVLNAFNLDGTWVESLLLDGVIAGVGSLLAFVPVLMALYCALAILEDSGYMARAAFVMDRFMHVLGLHGKSFLPLIVGFGCSVPGIFATRTLENEKDRILTSLMVPFMSCGARLPVYVLIAGIFFAEKAGQMVFWMYFIGITIAILVGLTLKNTLFRSREESPFVLELPPYRIPTIKAIWFHMWEHTSSFIQKAGSLILLISLFVWLLLAIPANGSGKFTEVEMQSSAFASISNGFSYLLKPTGFGNWQNSGALISGIAAKEVIVSTFIQVYGMEMDGAEKIDQSFGEDLGEIITSFFQALVDMLKSIPKLVGIDLFADETEEDPSAVMPLVHEAFENSSGGHPDLAAFSFMVFILTYTPCMATLAALRKELGIRWMLLSAFGQLFIAWVISVLVFQGGVLLGLG